MGYSSTIPGMNGRFFDADYVGGKYIAVGDNGQIAETTDPTINGSWVGVSSGTTQQLLGVASSGNEYVVVGQNGTILRSTDATNWNSVNSGTTATISKVIWANGQYVAVGGSGGLVLTSVDGISWTKQTTPSGLNVIYDIAYNGKDYVAVSNDGSVLASKDAVSWQAEKLPGNPYLQGIVWDGNNFVTIGWDGQVFKGTKETTVNVQTTVAKSKLSVQIGPNSNDSLSIELSDVRSDKLGIIGIDVTTHEQCDNALTIIDNAINKVNLEMEKFGTYQNRLEHVLNNVGNYEVNLSDAESRIRDVDIAKEMINQSKESVLAQAAQTMLAQANQQPQQVLQLLRG